MSGGFLYRCKGCGLGFRFPRLSKAELDELYRGGSPSAWEHGACTNRPDWDMARAAFRDRFAGRFCVLDVGCFDGAFLCSVGDCARFGIEISQAAADRAAARAVNVLARDFEALESVPTRFDAVTAFDIIEHVADPHRFLHLIERVLKPGGLLVVSTGDFDSPTWRLMKHRYWYSAFPEHISYLSYRWFVRVSTTTRLRIVSCRRFAHARVSWGKRASQAAANLAFLASPNAVAFLRKALRASTDGRRELDDYPPTWMGATDHILVILEKRASP